MDPAPPDASRRGVDRTVLFYVLVRARPPAGAASTGLLTGAVRRAPCLTWPFARRRAEEGGGGGGEWLVRVGVGGGP